MFNLEVSNGSFKVVTFDRYFSKTLLEGFYSTIYKRPVVTKMLEGAWWYSSEELREIAHLMDFHTEKLTEDK